MTDDKSFIHKCPECGATGSLHDINCLYGEDPLPSDGNSSSGGGGGAILGIILGLVLLALVCVLFNIDIENIPTFFAGLLYIFGISFGIALVQFIISLFG